MLVVANPTGQIVHLNGIPARIWEATTSGGTKCLLFVTRVAVPEGEDTSQFERELAEQKPPSIEAMRAFPLRMVL